MSAENAQELTAPQGLRPAQMGVLLLGRVTLGNKPLLAGLAERLGAIMHRFQKDLMADAVHHGWLRHLHHDQRTAESEELAVAIRSFRSGLRHLKASGSGDAMAARLSYAVLFGTRDGWRGMGLGGAIVLSSNL
jgi:hypothetical protein